MRLADLNERRFRPHEFGDTNVARLMRTMNDRYYHSVFRPLTRIDNILLGTIPEDDSPRGGARFLLLDQGVFIGFVGGVRTQDAYTVETSALQPGYRGQGLMKRVYLYLFDQTGAVFSDESQTPMGTGIWRSLMKTMPVYVVDMEKGQYALLDTAGTRLKARVNPYGEGTRLAIIDPEHRLLSRWEFVE